MFFNATIQVADMTVTPQDDHVMVGYVVAMVLPGGNIMPMGEINVALSKEGALAKGQELIDAGTEAEEPKPVSDILIATNMSGVEAAAKQVEKITKAAKGKK